jgi:single-stranded-DNA-specific exonuclease
LEREQIGAYHIGFVLGPCINAGGRLDTAKRALELFSAKDKETADRLAGDLKALNDSRKELTREGVEEAIRQVQETARRIERVLVIYLPDCHESIAGIIAGKVKERFYRPTIVLTDAEEGIKGSGRSIEGYHMFEELCKCGDIFTKFGGHPMAAGMSLPKEKLSELRRRLNENCTLTEEQMMEKINIDIAMPIQYVTEEFIEELKVLEPFGNGNGKPLFAEREYHVLQTQVLGKNKNVVKLYGANGAGCHMEGLYFGNPEELLELLQKKDTISVTYYPSVNEFRGRKTLQLMIQDFQ